MPQCGTGVDVEGESSGWWAFGLNRVAAALVIVWLECGFSSNGVAQTAQKGCDTFGERTKVEQSALDMGKRTPLAHETLKLLYRRPIVCAADLERELSITTPTANKMINTLIEKEILIEMTGQQRGRSYASDRYLGSLSKNDCLLRVRWIWPAIRLNQRANQSRTSTLSLRHLFSNGLLACSLVKESAVTLTKAARN